MHYGIAEEVSKENILKYVTPYDIFCFYMPWFVANRTIKTPFKSEKHGSFWTKVYSDGNIWFKDYGRNVNGDCFQLVQELFGYNFPESLHAVNTDMKLGLGDSGLFDVDITNSRRRVHRMEQPAPQEDPDIRIKVREWTIEDLQYWASHGIDHATASFYTIVPIAAYWIRGKKYLAKKHVYSWLVHGKRKIYQPFNTEFKWFGDIQLPQGDEQLPQYGDILLLQSSLKDTACVKACYDVPGVSSISETTPFDPIYLQDYERRFNRICVLYDNDKAGIASSTSLAVEHGYESIFLPVLTNKKTKDPSAFVYHGQKVLLDDVMRSYSII